MKKKILAAVSALALCLPSVGISGVTPVSALSVIAEITSVSVEKTELAVGETVSAVIEWSIGLEQTVYFSSTDPSVADVDQYGNVTAVGVGTASIVCSVSYGENKEFEITVVPAEPGPVYPTSYKEYTAMLESYPDYYRIDKDSIYFLNHNIHNMEMSLVVSSNNFHSVSNDTYGFVFRPKEDGRYVVTVEEYCEEIVSDESELGHYHRFYPEIFMYVVDVENGEISMSYQGDYSWKESENAENVDILDGAYFSYVNGHMPPLEDDRFDRYITTVYGEYVTNSYFCINAGFSDVDVIPFMPRVVTSDNKIAYVDMTTTTSSDATADDIMDFFRVKALSAGEVTVTVDGTDTYNLIVMGDGVFQYDNPITPMVPGDVNGDVLIDESDIECLCKYLLGVPGTTINKKAADLNSDGVINVFDLCILKRKVIVPEKRIDYLVLGNEWVRDNYSRCETMTDQIYMAQSFEELQGIIENHELCENSDCTCQYHYAERCLPEDMDEKFFENNAVIVMYSQSGGSNKYISVYKIVREQERLTVYTTTERQLYESPDMAYNRIILEIDRESIQGVNDVLKVNTDVILGPAVIDEFTPCTATLEDDFDDWMIHITIKHQYSVPGRVWTTDDFKGIDNIRSMHQYEATSPYRQYITIGLEDKSKENVLKMIHDIEALNLVEIKQIITVKHGLGEPPEDEFDEEEYNKFFENSTEP